MRISDSHRLLFVHVQKTGGVTMEHVLGEQLPDLRQLGEGRHETLRMILNREPQLKRYWIVGFVRNPWARMLSWWSMIQEAAEAVDRGEDSEETQAMGRNPFWQAVARYPDFETFVDRGPEEHPRLRRPQLQYLTTKTRRADFVGRTETFDADMRAVLARLGLGAPAGEELPRLNSSRYRSYRDHYSPTGRDKVAGVFRRDIESFGYEF